jgi:hypothetical protein
MRADGTKALGGKARMRQRIETLEARPHHPEYEHKNLFGTKIFK